MRKIFIAAAVSFLIVAGCDRGVKPNPKPQKTYTVPAATAVIICVDPAVLRRVKDQDCTEDGYGWIYISPRPVWPKELPAVGEMLQAGRGDWTRPAGLNVETIPEAGAFFP